MDHWLDELRTGQVEVLGDILEELGPAALVSLAHKSREEQIKSLVSALRHVEKQAGKYRGSDSAAFVVKAFAAGLDIPVESLTHSSSVPLEPSVRMGVLRSLAQREAKVGRSMGAARKVMLTMAVVLTVVALATVVLHSSSASRVAAVLEHQLPGVFHYLDDAPGQKAWVLVSQNGETQVSYVAQPGNEQPVGTTIAELSLPAGEIVAVLPEGDLIHADAHHLRRVNPQGEVWVRPRPAGEITYLSNQLLVFYNPAEGRVVTLDTNGNVLQDGTGFPQANFVSLRFAPFETLWHAATISGLPASQIYDSTGVILGEVPYKGVQGDFSLNPQRRQVIVGDSQARLTAYSYTGEVLWQIPFMRPGWGYVPEVFHLLEPDLYFASFREIRTSGFSPNSISAAVTPEGRVLWKRDYLQAAPAGNQVGFTRNGSLAIFAGSNRSREPLLMVTNLNGRMVTRIDHEIYDTFSKYRVADILGTAWVGVIYDDSFRIYRAP